MRLEEHHYRKRFSATIVGPVLVAGEPYYDGMYLLKLDSNVVKKLSLEHVLFLPQWYEFRRGLLIRVGRVPKQGSNIGHLLRDSCSVAMLQFELSAAEFT